MSKRTAFSRKSEQRHWRLLHEREETERQQRRVAKWQRKSAHTQDSDLLADHDDENAPRYNLTDDLRDDPPREM